MAASDSTCYGVDIGRAPPLRAGGLLAKTTPQGLLFVGYKTHWFAHFLNCSHLVEQFEIV